MNQDKASDPQLDQANHAAGPSLPVRPAADREPAPREWRGHLSATQAALEQLLMRASLGHDDFSLAERVFAQACELRCQVATGGWSVRIGANRHELELSRYILLALGAENLSEDLATVVDKVKTSGSRRSQKAMLRHFETRLAAQGSTLDALLARYAERLWSCPDSPGGST